MAEELGWVVEDFDLALSEALALGMVKADMQARVFWLPNAAKHNPPASLNVVKSWARAFELLPDCPLKWEARESLRTVCYGVSKSMGEVFDQALPLPRDMPKPLPSGIQKAVSSKQVLKDQNILSDAEKDQRQTGTPDPDEKIFISLPVSGGGGDYPVPESYLATLAGLYPAVDIRQEIRNMRGWLDANPRRQKTRTGIKRFITSWLQTCQNSPPSVGARFTGRRDINQISTPETTIPDGFRGA
ncbi:hypothetical protein [Pantoea agglomerans]|uniref:hypothetical protein n=1 Tax=Enterobacter agglomerans TaxID=549 RepID=UPI002413A7B4|nr:hypothetical protein [Pantoea agglomerans]